MLDPTETLLRAKEDEGLLYWRTDTHWNQKGSYLAFSAMMERLDLKYPQIQFELSGEHNGDLIDISSLYDFATHNDDNWKGTVRNEQGFNDLVVWVVGDSFANSIKPYLNASFSNIKYLGHWSSTIDELPSILSESDEKPDLMLIVRVERSF